MEGFDYIQAIGAELQKADQLAAEMSERIGIFTKTKPGCTLAYTMV